MEFMEREWKIRSCVLMMSICLFLSGCMVLALSAGATGGYAISKDEIEGYSDKSYDHVWKAGWEVLNREGAINMADQNAGRIEAYVKDSKVTFEVDQISPTSLRVRVQSRKAMNLFPDIKLAQSVYNQIMRQVGP